MHDIEKKITDNLPYFNDIEPEQGHKARFTDKLNQNLPVTKKVQLSMYLKIAAAILLLIATSYIILKYESKNSLRDEQYIAKIEYSNELYKVQSYYDELSLSRLTQIDELASSVEEAQRLKSKAIKKMEKLDANLAKIEKEYVKNPQCDKLKAAIVNNKKMKVKVVDNIVEQLDNVQRGYHAGSMYTNF